MRTFTSRALAASLLITLAARLTADPVRWIGNGHFYDVVSIPNTISWEQANAAANAAGGYLATITSLAENSFVFSLVNNPLYWHGFSGPWLGGYQQPATQEPGANWRWVTGETWSYTNWQPAQPNDSGGKTEDKLQFGFASLVSVWNDIMSIDPTPAYRPIAYVVEWDLDPLAPTIEVSYSRATSQVELCWLTAPNRSYLLLSSTNLTANQWAPLHANWVPGDGTKHCQAAIIQPGTSAQFYRLLCTNVPPP